MFGMCIYSYSELTYNRVYVYPRWAIVFGWMLACSSVTFIPIVAIWKFVRAKGTFKEVSIRHTEGADPEDPPPPFLGDPQTS